MENLRTWTEMPVEASGFKVKHLHLQLSEANYQRMDREQIEMVGHAVRLLETALRPPQ